MERTDNLKVIMLNKSEFLLKIFNNEVSISSVYVPISVNVIHRTVEDISSLSILSAMQQVNENEYVWLAKIHE